jgi:hypothetical protein
MDLVSFNRRPLQEGRLTMTAYMFRPTLEALEDRCTPSTVSFTVAQGGGHSAVSLLVNVQHPPNRIAPEIVTVSRLLPNGVIQAHPPSASPLLSIRPLGSGPGLGYLRPRPASDSSADRATAGGWRGAPSPLTRRHARRSPPAAARPLPPAPASQGGTGRRASSGTATSSSPCGPPPPTSVVRWWDVAPERVEEVLNAAFPGRRFAVEGEVQTVHRA